MPKTATPATWQAYSRQDAAQILGVTVSAVDAVIRRGELTTFRVGKHIRITDAVLRRFAGQDVAA